MKYLALVCCLGLSAAACGDDPERRAPLPQPSALSPAPEPTPPGPTPPAPSPASYGPIAFVSTRDGSPHIYLANADGSGATRLTTGEKPAWSRDGRRLVFQRSGDGIFVINADGSGERWLASGRAPDWSPDGTRVVFADSYLSGGISVVSADGSGQKLLLRGEFVQPGDGVESPTWSPDGRRIAFVRANYDEPWQIYVMNADGSDPRRLIDGGDVQTQAEPAWSPDGTTIAFQTHNGIAAVNVSSPRWALVQSGMSFDPDWLPDGRGFVFNQFTGPADAEQFLGSRMRIFVSSGNSVRRLIPDAVDPTVPDYADRDVAYARTNR